jgi:IS5 family transposase
MGRPSLAEALVSETLGQNQRLERIDDAVDWERLGRVVASVHAAPRGRPSYPPLLMVKVLLLQQWYSLSDPQLETFA